MKCRCGSGKERYALKDAAGIFLTYVCEVCEPETRRGYNPRIFDTNTRYASSGEERDIGADDDWD
jgi:hypothetical protein